MAAGAASVGRCSQAWQWQRQRADTKFKTVTAGCSAWLVAAGYQPSAAGPAMVSGVRGTRPLVELIKWGSAQVLCAQVASTRSDFQRLAAGLSTSAYRQLKLDGQSQKEDRKAESCLYQGCRQSVF
eukprot:3986442-Amphidinium_carterae.1